MLAELSVAHSSKQIAALYFGFPEPEKPVCARNVSTAGGKRATQKVLSVCNKRKKSTVAQLPRGYICALSHRIKNITCFKVRYSCIIPPHSEVLLSTRKEVTANNDLFLQGDREGRVQTLKTTPDNVGRNRHAGLQLVHAKNRHNCALSAQVSALKVKLQHVVMMMVHISVFSDVPDLTTNTSRLSLSSRPVCRH